MIQPKLKHLRHPLRTLQAAERIVSTYGEIMRMGDRGRQRYRQDPRYQLVNVTKGFAPRPVASPHDGEILERICAAYGKAAGREPSATDSCQPSEWWQQIRSNALAPVREALAARDFSSLRRMYGNFFRDPCSTGLIAVPFGMKAAYFGRSIRDLHRRYFLASALHTIDHWEVQTGGRFTWTELAAPEIGNPFGIVIDGTLVRTGAPYQHYSAHRLRECIGSAPSTVVEIGGGYGGTAYYLLRDRAGTTYIDFDLPESLALTAYHLMSALPHLRFLLYGEGDLSPQNRAHFDVLLMPLWEMESMNAGSADLAFSSHAVTDLSPRAMRACLHGIARIANGCFLCIGNARGSDRISATANEERLPLRLLEKLPSAWNAQRSPDFDEVECVFAVPPASRHAEPAETRA